MRVVVAPLAEFPPGSRRIVDVGNRSIGVLRVGDAFYAVRNRCPHQGGPLCTGRVFRRAVSDAPGRVRYTDGAPLIACPWHGWEYDLATGQSFMGPGPDRVRAYDVSVQRGGAVVAMREDDLPPLTPRQRRGGMEEAEERTPGPYVAETFPVRVEEEYVVLDA
jgi:nitrite reductase/ring-hydroxylating ferredoxin subunit